MNIGTAALLTLAAIVAGKILGRVPAKTLFTLMVIFFVLFLVVVGSHYAVHFHVFGRG